MSRDRDVKRRQKLAEAAEIQHARIGLAKFITGCVAAPLTALALYPVASVLAGEDTNVNVNVAVNIAITTSIAAGVTGVGYQRQKRRADRLEARNQRLELAVTSEQGGKKALETRIAGLEKDLDRARLALPPGKAQTD